MTHDVAAQKCIEYIHLGSRLVAESQTTDCSSNGTITYQHLNHLGTPVFTSDENGQTNQAEALMPYGLPYSGNHVQGIGFTGHLTDAGVKLVNMQQRLYDPLMRRFLSVDPVTPSTYDGSNLNRYWYANNNPYKYTDPDGRLAWFIPLIVGTSLFTISNYANAPAPGEETYSMTGAEAAIEVLSAFPAGRAARAAKTAVWAAKPSKKSGKVRDAKKGQKSISDQMSAEEAARYEKALKTHAPEQSSPYNRHNRYNEDGSLKQTTTYDKFGRRHRQYDVKDRRRSEHQHNFEYNSKYPKGKRSTHLPIDE